MTKKLLAIAIFASLSLAAAGQVAASEIGKLAFDEAEEIEQLLDEAQQQIFGVSQKPFSPLDS